ncbi:MAG: SPOR domain-containing protein [Candidatus Margulisiibacteriota bacterium]
MFRWFRNLALVAALIAVIVLSFWISFLIGKRMLVPVKKIPTQYLITDEAKLELPPEITLEVEGLTFESGAFVSKKPPLLKKHAVEKTTLRKHKRAAPVVEIKKAAIGAYTVQVGSFSHRKNAQALVAGLKQKGFTGTIIVSGKWFKVCSGNFEDKEQAVQYLEKLGASGFEGIVRRDN